MDLYDWLIFLHVLSAFLAVGALTAPLGARAQLERRHADAVPGLGDALPDKPQASSSGSG